MENTKCQVDQRFSNYGGQILHNEQGLKEMCVIVPKENETCVQAPPKKEMCTIVHPNTDIELENNQIPCCEQEKKVMCIKVNKKEKSLILNGYSDNDFAFSLNQKINKIDSLIGTLPKEKVYLAEAQSEISTYDLMSMFLEKFFVLTRKKKFYLYNGKYYEISDVSSIKQKMLGAFREVVRDKNISFIEGAVKYLLIEPNIVIEDKDVRDDLVAFDNKVLNINTGLTYAHSPDYIVTYAINASYIDEYCPLTPVFDDFLEQITGGDVNLIARIWMMIGYVLTPDTKAKCIFLLQGVGNSGKSIIVKLLQRLLSNDAFFPFDMDSLS